MASKKRNQPNSDQQKRMTAILKKNEPVMKKFICKPNARLEDRDYWVDRYDY